MFRLWLSGCVFLFFFFFQAEDGIRDKLVTGVQTCALPIARRWSGDLAALAAGLLFAVHPVHVEAVANIVGRAELMATLFATLAVYAALAGDRVWWSAVAFAAGLLSKENAVVGPGLVAWGG